MTLFLAVTLAGQLASPPLPGKSPPLAVEALRAPPPAGPTDLVYFVPPLPGQMKTAEAAIVEAIGTARRSILVQAYSFTSVPIADALIAARRRGVPEVEAILDPGDISPRNPIPDRLAAGGVALAVDHGHAIAHNKIIILDRATVLQGSYNFTAAAEHHNAENLRVRYRDPCAELYVRNWHLHRSEARTLVWPSSPSRK